MRSRLHALSILGSVFLATGCPARDISGLDTGHQGEVLANINIVQNRDVDVLFVVDNSSSMSDKQDLVATNFPNFIHKLESIRGGLPNLHIGVTSSSVDVGYVVYHCAMPDNGLLQNTAREAGCPVPKDGARYISNIQQADGSRQTNYDGELTDVFACIARLGVGGCDYEQHLEAVKRALDGSRSENDGFLRSGAYLVVVILGDEDDCSAKDTGLFNTDPALDTLSSSLGPQGSFRCTEFGVRCDGKNLTRDAADYSSCAPRNDSYLWGPQHYVDFLLSLKSDPNLVLTAVIAGDTAPFSVGVRESDDHPFLEHSCNFQIAGHDNAADPAIRLAAFADKFGERGQFLSVCQEDYSGALQQIADLIGHFVGVACLGGQIDVTDTKPNDPGLQLNCVVSDYPNDGGSGEQELPRCPMIDDQTPDTSSTPCWWTKIDADACPSAKSPTHAQLFIERNGEQAPFGTHVVARCSTSN